MATNQEQVGLAWQIGVWNRISDIYLREIDQRFAPVVERVLARAQVKAGNVSSTLAQGQGRSLSALRRSLGRRVMLSGWILARRC